jgi:hypothetical protein
MDVQEPRKDQRRLVPRIASVIDGILAEHGSEALFASYSTFVLRRNFGISWVGASKPHTLQEDEAAFAYLHECKQVEQLKEAIKIATEPILRHREGRDPKLMEAIKAALEPRPLDVTNPVVRQSVDIISTQLAFHLKGRTNAPGLAL